MAAAPKPLTDAQKAEIKVVFEKYDTNKSNSIDKTELRAVLEESLHRNLPDKLYTKYVDTMFSMANKNGDAEIQFDEFCTFYAKVFVDPELPIAMGYKPVQRNVKLESGENSPKVQKTDSTVILTDAEKQEALQLLSKYDADKSGTITRDELTTLLKDKYGKKMSDKMIERFVEINFNLADKDGSGQIDSEEFLILYTKVYKESGLARAPSVGKPN